MYSFICLLAIFHLCPLNKLAGLQDYYPLSNLANFDINVCAQLYQVKCIDDRATIWLSHVLEIQAESSSDIVELDTICLKIYSRILFRILLS